MPFRTKRDKEIIKALKERKITPDEFAQAITQVAEEYRSYLDPDRPFSLGWIGGTILDILLDPLNLIDGWIKSAKVILGGKKVISGRKVIGGLDEAVDVVKTLDLAADSADVAKTARDLLGKTTRKLGYLDDFQA